MPRSVQIVIACDICNSDAPPQNAVALTVNRQTVGIDLCSSHRDRFDKALAPFIENGHRRHDVLDGNSRGPKPAASNAANRPTTANRRAPIPCPQGCGAEFSPASMAKHVTRCDGTPPAFPCKVGDCKAGFVLAKSLEQHHRVTHGLTTPESRRPYRVAA